MAVDRALDRFDEKQLERLIDEAIVDCYNTSEQAVGLFTMIEDKVRVPFRALDGDEEVVVIGFELDDMLATATCERDGEQEDIPLMGLTLAAPLPEGAAWIAAYCHWAHHVGVDYDDEDDEDEA